MNGIPPPEPKEPLGPQPEPPKGPMPRPEPMQKRIAGGLALLACAFTLAGCPFDKVPDPKAQGAATTR